MTARYYNFLPSMTRSYNQEARCFDLMRSPARYRDLFASKARYFDLMLSTEKSHGHTTRYCDLTWTTTRYYGLFSALVMYCDHLLAMKRFFTILSPIKRPHDH